MAVITFKSALLLTMPILVTIVTLTWPIGTVAIPGGRQNIPDAGSNKDLQKLASFAVKQYNSQQGLKLKYLRLVAAEEQVVSGIMYYLHLQAKSGRKTCEYEAKVWVQDWKNWRSLEGFTLQECS